MTAAMMEKVVTAVRAATVGRLDSFFYRYGKFVATHPLKVMGVALTCCILCGLGLVNFKSEADADKLYHPQDSDYLKNQEWRKDHFVDNKRLHYVILNHDTDVLNQEALLKLKKLHEIVNGVTFENKTFHDICVQIPIINLQRDRIGRQSQENQYDYQDYFNFYGDDATEGGEVDESNFPSGVGIDALPRDIYCDLANTLQKHCAEYSVLELWNFEEAVVRNLSRTEIVAAINEVKVSPVYGWEMDYKWLLGGKKIHNISKEYITEATSIMNLFWTEWDPSKKEDDVKLLGLDFKNADRFTMEWEAELIRQLLDFADELEQEGTGFHLHIFVKRSFSDASSDSLLFDTGLMIAGYALMFLYTVAMLGRPNAVEQRAYLAMAGISAVGMGMVVSLGLTMAFGFFYTTIHGVLPFLAMGIGIDDMFVIMQCMSNLSDEQKSSLPLPERIGQTMRKAGVAITVTSLTDVCAFGVGAVTILPGLQSFCVSCAIAIGTIFLLQTSWFVAFLTLDQQRIDDRRNGCFPCVVHKEWKKKLNHQEEFSVNKIMTKVAEVLRYKMVQITVVAITMGLLSVGIYGASQIKVAFDPFKLLDQSGYLSKFFDVYHEDFPGNGWPANIFTGEIRYTLEDFAAVDQIVTNMEIARWNLTYVSEATFWWTPLRKYLQEKVGFEDWRDAFDDVDEFRLHLSDFLFHAEGAQSRKNFRWSGDQDLVCGQPAPDIKSTDLGGYRYYKTAPVDARDMVEGFIAAANLSSHAFSECEIYSAWESDAVIAHELIRNLGLAFACIATITLVMLVNLRLCFFVLLTVLLTLVDVIGISYFWGLSIDPLVCMGTVLVVGLCVDYSVHIAHAFSDAEGESSGDRASAALITIGPAIFNGGTTTFLALVFLAFSTAYGYVVQFKIFSLSVGFGLFHGLVFLPVILNVLGGSIGKKS